MMFGIKFSGFIAWWMWRTIYLAKLPRLPKKLRLMMDWTLDFFFGREIEQMVTFRDVEAIADRLARVHARTIQMNQLTAAPLPGDTFQSIARS